LPWQKQHSTRRRLFTGKLDLNLRKKLIKCYIWSTALYGADTWALQKVDRYTCKILKCGAGEDGEINWTDRVSNEEVLHRVKEERNILHMITGLVTSSIGTAF
jgi:hypothetical protein